MSWDGNNMAQGLTDDDVYAAMAAATAGRRRPVLAVLAVEAEDPELRRAQHVRRRVLLAGAEDDAAADEQHQPFSRQPHAQGADSFAGSL